MFGRMVTPTSFTAISNAAVVDTPPKSATCTTTFEIPPAVGFPVIAPLAASSVNPSGNIPAWIVHKYGCTPPDACNVCEYAPPISPPGSEVVEIPNVSAWVNVVEPTTKALAIDVAIIFTEIFPADFAGGTNTALVALICSSVPQPVAPLQFAPSIRQVTPRPV